MKEIQDRADPHPPVAAADFLFIIRKFCYDKLVRLPNTSLSNTRDELVTHGNLNEF